MNKHIRNTLAAVGVIGFIVIMFSNSSISGAIESHGQASSAMLAASVSGVPATDSLQHSSLPEHAQSLAVPVSTISALPVINSESPRATWQAIQGAPEPFAVASAVKEKLTVDMNGVDLGTTTPGERMNFTMPDGSNVVARVENTWTESNGDKAWSGHVEDAAGPDYRILVTQGSAATFASINTSKGTYTLESINGRGVVYKNPEMGDVAPHGTTDYLVPGK